MSLARATRGRTVRTPRPDRRRLGEDELPRSPKESAGPTAADRPRRSWSRGAGLKFETASGRDCSTCAAFARRAASARRRPRGRTHRGRTRGAQPGSKSPSSRMLKIAVRPNRRHVAFRRRRRRSPPPIVSSRLTSAARSAIGSVVIPAQAERAQRSRRIRGIAATCPGRRDPGGRCRPASRARAARYGAGSAARTRARPSFRRGAVGNDLAGRAASRTASMSSAESRVV